MPNFFVIGAAKAGTTSLYSYLDEHPQIFMCSEKEPRFFLPEFYTTFNKGLVRGNQRKSAISLEEYEAMFDGVTNELAIGEASTEYIYYPEVSIRIKQQIPNAKLIAILRDPIERAFSAYCYQVRDGCENLSFEESLDVEAQRIQENWRAGWHYKRNGFYYDQIKQYLNTFDRNQIRIYIHQDLRLQPLGVCQDIFEFLGVDKNFSPNLTRKNVSKLPKVKWLNYLHKRNNPLKSSLKQLLPENISETISNVVKKHNLSSKPKLDPELRKSLIPEYKDDILMLQDLIDRDLSDWLKV